MRSKRYEVCFQLEGRRTVGGDERLVAHRAVGRQALRSMGGFLQFQYDTQLRVPTLLSVTWLAPMQQNRGRFEHGGLGCR